MFKTLFTYKIKNYTGLQLKVPVFKTPPAWTSCDPQAGLENDHPVSSGHMDAATSRESSDKYTSF